MTPVIAMPGPWLPEATPGREDPARVMPALPALDELLRRAQRLPDAVDWRRGVLAALGAAAPLAPAAVAARAVATTAEGTGICFAAPLHVIAGLSRVHLPPGGRLPLDAAEEQAWCAAFNAEFGGDGVALHVAAPGGGWLLQAPFAAAARDAAPEQLLGAPLERRPAGDAAERGLRRLLAESEMWLAAHALNRAREARGEPALNALWCWGGATVQQLPTLHAPGAILARGAPDAWLAGLAKHCGQRLQSASTWEQALHAAGAAATALLVPAPDNAGPSRQYWEMVEENWMAPALRDCRRGRVAALRLQVGRSAWQFPARGWRRWVRWPRPAWWQLAGEPQT